MRRHHSLIPSRTSPFYTPLNPAGGVGVLPANWPISASVLLNRAISALSGSAKSGLWDFRQAYDDAGTLTASDLSGNGNPMLQPDANRQGAVSSVGITLDGNTTAANADGMDAPISGNCSANSSVYLLVRSTDNAGHVVVDQSGAGRYLGVFLTGDGNTILRSGAGTPQIFVDGVELVHGVNTRGDLQAAVCDGDWHIVKFTGANLSTWSGIRTGYYASFTASPFYALNADIMAEVLIDQNAVADASAADAAVGAWLESIRP